MNKKVEYKTYGEYSIFLEGGFYCIKDLQEVIDEAENRTAELKHSLQKTEESSPNE